MPKVKNEYDENGRWIQERNRIKGAMRRAFRLSPQMKEVLQEARVELPPALKKDGTPGKRPQVRYKCAICKELFPRKYIQVDHIEPVVPLTKSEANMSYDELADNIFCPKSGLQVVCSTPMKYNDGMPSCHKKKTDEENYVRREYAKRCIPEVKVEFQKGLIEALHKEFHEVQAEKEAKKNARKKRKSKKRKSDT